MWQRLRSSTVCSPHVTSRLIRLLGFETPSPALRWPAPRKGDTAGKGQICEQGTAGRTAGEALSTQSCRGGTLGLRGHQVQALSTPPVPEPPLSPHPMLPDDGKIDLLHDIHTQDHVLVSS